MGGNYTSPKPQSTDDMLGSYAKWLPQLFPEVNSNTRPAAEANLKATQDTQPAYNKLNLDMLKQFALPQAEVGQQVATSNALAGANTNLSQIKGPGGDAASAAVDLTNKLSPAYAAAQKGAAEGVNSINMSGLSPGEAAAIERSTNQGNTATGNLGNLNATNTIANAMNFGGAFNSKLGLLNNATGSANSVAANGVINPTNVALGQPNTSTAGNFGTAQFGNGSSATSAGSQGNAFNFAGGLMNTMNSGNNARLGADAQIQTENMAVGSPSSYLGALCCFIFLEAYNGKLPPCVRKGRDKYYSVNMDISAGYRRMASWLVPLMSSNMLVLSLVNLLMIKPITEHLYNVQHNKKSKTKKLTHFWLKLWAWYGKGKLESDYNGAWYYSTMRGHYGI